MVLTMGRWKGKVAVITGAGGGIGGAITKLLIEEGIHVVGIDRRSDSLVELSKTLQNKKGKFHHFAIDISQDEEVKNLFKKISNEIGPVHILVNSAGILQQTNLIDGDTTKWRKVFDVNVIGLSIMTREAIKVMKENKIDGHVVHIGSYGGHVIKFVPNVINMYGAAKSAVNALTETLRQELNHLGLKIKVSCVSPGFVDTEIRKHNDFQGELSTRPKTQPMLRPDDVANAILYALSTPPHVQVHQLIIKPVGETL